MWSSLQSLQDMMSGASLPVLSFQDSRSYDENLSVQVVYKRYASLYFVMGIDMGDNELITLEIIHHYVEVLDRYFGNVCELDLIFNFHKVCRMLRSPPLCNF